MRSLLRKVSSVAPFLMELAAYAGLMAVYFFLVSRFLSGWIKEVFDDNKALYALLAVALIGVQGIVLEMVTSALFGTIRRKEK